MHGSKCTTLEIAMLQWVAFIWMFNPKFRHF
jgi:hypothetical protein